MCLGKKDIEMKHSISKILFVFSLLFVLSSTLFAKDKQSKSTVEKQAVPAAVTVVTIESAQTAEYRKD